MNDARAGGALHRRIAIRLPAHDEARAADAMEDLLGAAAKHGAQELSLLLEKDQGARDLLLGVFGASPFLTGLAVRAPSLLAECLLREPESHLSDAVTELRKRVGEASSQEAAMRDLRRFKQRIALLTALADLGGVWPIERVCSELSAAAEAATAAAVEFLIRREAGRSKLQSADAASSGFFVLAMGKLGARELNYSSDIDLIAFYDRGRARVPEGAEPSTLFVRLTRDLVRMLQERTVDGYVFRTDLRLRPDPGATQIALSTEAGLTYYESFGQNWERAAMIKARTVAGDIAAGEAFLAALAPFVWRRYLDYAAIADIHAMKRRVHAHKGHGKIAVAGHDIKLGRAGIRDIEFFVQTQQLIAGGRQPELRDRRTLVALDRLAEKSWIELNVAQDMADAYRFYRRVEHRLQMIGDQQVYTLPEDSKGMGRVAALMGYADTDVFSTDLLGHLCRVEDYHEGLFERLPSAPNADAPSLVVGAVEADPVTRERLSSLGFREPATVLEAVRGWQSGRYASVRSERARQRLAEVLLPLLEALSRTADPELAFNSFDRFVAQLPAGVQLFSLLSANPNLLRLVAEIMGTAPRLARVLGRRARLLDAVLDPGFFGDLPDAGTIRKGVTAALHGARDLQETLDRARIHGREQAFLIGVRVLSGTVTEEQAGGAFTLLAETLIAALHTSVEADFAERHGRAPGGQSAVLAMGKLGGREMTAASDLDLIVIYDFEGDDARSDGPRPLSAPQYYARLTQRLISALTAQTAEGALYAVDMRLRPSGNSGPVATRLASFIEYQQERAWTWEHMALTRARVISGSPELCEKIETAIRDVLSRPRDRDAIARDVREMRARIEREKGARDVWDLKQVRGGLVDLEFLAQFHQLVGAHERPDILDQNTAASFAKLARAGLLPAADADVLLPAARLYHNLTQLLRLCLDRNFDPATAPEGLKSELASAGGASDFESLQAELRETLAAVHEIFDRTVGLSETSS